MVKELGLKLPNVASVAVNGGGKRSDREKGCGKEPEGGGNPAEDTSKCQQDQQVEGSLESTGKVSATGHVTEPAEQKEKTSAEGDKAASDEVKTVSDEMESSSGEINGRMDVPASPSALRSDVSWADVVSKSRGKATAVNGEGDGSTANEPAEE